MWNVITYPCLIKLLLAPTASYVAWASYCVLGVWYNQCHCMPYCFILGHVDLKYDITRQVLLILLLVPVQLAFLLVYKNVQSTCLKSPLSWYNIICFEQMFRTKLFKLIVLCLLSPTLPSCKVNCGIVCHPSNPQLLILWHDLCFDLTPLVFRILLSIWMIGIMWFISRDLGVAVYFMSLQSAKIIWNAKGPVLYKISF